MYIIMTYNELICKNMQKDKGGIMTKAIIGGTGVYNVYKVVREK